MFRTEFESGLIDRPLFLERVKNSMKIIEQVYAFFIKKDGGWISSEFLFTIFVSWPGYKKCRNIFFTDKAGFLYNTQIFKKNRIF